MIVGLFVLTIVENMHVLPHKYDQMHEKKLPCLCIADNCFQGIHEMNYNKQVQGYNNGNPKKTWNQLNIQPQALLMSIFIVGWFVYKIYKYSDMKKT